MGGPPPRAGAAPTVQGAPEALEDAYAAAARVLAEARQPLFAGLATDIAGARALYALANDCHAILDHAGFDGMLPQLRTLQDRGLLLTTLAELRARADLVVFAGTRPSERYPEFLPRWVAGPPARELVFLGTDVDAAALSLPHVRCRALPWHGDAYATLALANALVAGHRVPAPAPLAGLAAALQAARYAVIVWEPAVLPGPQPALLVESINALLKTLNQRTRAGGLALAGDDGAATVNQTVTWLSGLPLRSGVLARGLVHEPHRFGTASLLAQGAVDALLWVAGFLPVPPPPADGVPTVLLGHPALASAPAQVFVPVATAGIGADGHLFRLDGAVVQRLRAVRDEGLPGVAQAVAGIRRHLQRLRAL
ncbi:MAG: formylmethanofuran dehydrogenase [Burkholderiaceae bacterium]|nr:formylmethanofuran dehydrogenase [Burkholderiaceae bacterium]